MNVPRLNIYFPCAQWWLTESLTPGITIRTSEFSHGLFKGAAIEKVMLRGKPFNYDALTRIY